MQNARLYLAHATPNVSHGRTAYTRTSARPNLLLWTSGRSVRPVANSRWKHTMAYAALGLLLNALLLLCCALSGCNGGYPGTGLGSITASATTIDAGQSITLKVADTANLPVAWTMSGSACSGSSCGTFSNPTGTSGTYTAPSTVSAPMQVVLVASVSGTGNQTSVTVTVNPDPAIVGVPPAGVVGQPYSTTLATTGGTGKVTLSLAGGTLPAGLSFSAATGVISGTPTAAGTSSFTVQAVDQSSIPFTVTAQKAITVTAAATSTLTILGGNPPNGTVGTPYTTALTASGGTAPYTWSVIGGSLPPGLQISPTTGLISGTPTTQGTFPFTAQVRDANGATASASFAITISAAAGNGLTITTGSLPSGTVNVPYSAAIGVSGGTAPYTCAIISGTLQAGLTLGPNCLVSGTPTASGTVNVSIRATDSANPQNTGTGPVSLTINPTGSLALSAPPSGTQGQPYSGTIGVTGGTAPYSCVLASGTLQPGLTLGSNCVITGTPTGSGTSIVGVTATDSGNPKITTTGNVPVTINPPALSLTTGTLPDGTVSVPYSSVIGVSGGTSPYSCTITSGTLPAGLALGANCLVSGTPTTAGTSTVTVKATDSSNPQQSTTGPETITINSAGSLTLTGPATGTQGQPYSGTVVVSGGTGPYTCKLASGTLQTGLTLNANCTITGTPITSGTSTIGVTATDSSSPARTTTGNVPVTINPAGNATIAVGNPPPATVGQPYQGPLPITGGTTPYTCTLASGTLPTGLALGTNCIITGTPTSPGTSPISVTVTDGGQPPSTTTAPVTITVNPAAALSLTGTLPNGTVGQPYSQTIAANGGTAPYTYAITSGALPAGITLGTTTGTFGGTPTAAGVYSFTLTATDSSTTAQTASLPLTLVINYANTPNDGLLNGPYAFLFQGYDDAVAGVLAYQTAAIGSFTADGKGGISAGEQDSNHQAVNAGAAPSDVTVPTRKLLGTYTIGADDRGTLLLATLAADGTVEHTAVYAISVKAPMAPATTSASGSLIEFDSNQLAGTRGSGTFLQQTAAAYATGLSGSYAFGLQGDTPCLPACTANLPGGPVATVGQFTAAAGAIATGTADTNLSQANYPTTALAGTYKAADTNGRVQVSLTNSGIPYAAYPVDYAAYVVNANEVLLMSTDQHGSYILLAGSATLQTAAPFANASLSGAYVGYENAPTNPGLAGVALQNVANLSTATIFRGTANSTGTCTTTNVDAGGTTALVNGLTGLGSGSNVLNALLGTYESTGNSNCTVAGNGRAVLNYPVPSTVLSTTLALLGLSANPPAPRVAYLTGSNTGYFLETGYAGLGRLEQQVGAPFSLGTLDGTFVYGTSPAASAASLNASGVFTADGQGHTTATFDENVGVGTVNVLELGVTSNPNYVLTDATAGRYLLGASTVIYAIAPGRFVVLDTSALSTSPSVALLY